MISYRGNKLTLKAQRKNASEKMASAEDFCCKYMPNITDEIKYKVNRMDPDQTVPI